MIATDGTHLVDVWVYGLAAYGFTDLQDKNYADL